MGNVVRVRFRGPDGDSAVLSLPSHLKQTGALALGATFQWPALGRAFGFGFEGDFDVTAIGTEGNPFGEGELIVHVGPR